MSDPVPPVPWERQPGEPDICFTQFRYYRDMPLPRKILGVRDGSTADKWEWSSKWSWVSRATAYDDHISTLAIKEREETVKQQARDIGAEHMKILHGLREVLERETGKWMARLRTSENSTEPTMKPNELLKLADTVIKLERLVQGETTENIGAPKTDLSALSPEELSQLLALYKKAGL